MKIDINPQLKTQYLIDKPKVIYLDTECTGLNIMTNKPFLVAIGWNEHIFLTSPDDSFIKEIFQDDNLETIWLWNAKYDAHMLYNYGFEIPWKKWNDGIAAAMLAGYTDQTYTKIALKDLGAQLLGLKDSSVSQVETEFRKLTIAHKRKSFTQKGYSYTQIEKMLKQVTTQFSELPLIVQNEWKNYQKKPKPTYADLNFTLIQRYAKNDIFIMKELLEKYLLPKVKKRNQMEILKFEQSSLEPFWEQERKGLKIDRNYVLQSKEKIRTAILEGRQSLYTFLKKKIDVNQHLEIKKHLNQVFKLNLMSVGSPELLKIKRETSDSKLQTICNCIIQLRTLEKWYTTYCLRILDRIDEHDILRTSFNLFGAKTGRITSDFHQFPKEPLYDFNQQEIFNVRQMIIPHTDILAFFDYSEMELRIQCEFTHRFGFPDPGLTKAYLTKEKEDLHKKTAKVFFGEKKATLLRNVGKGLMFAFIYGSGIYGMQKQLENNPKIKTPSLAEITPLVHNLRQTYLGITNYQQKVRQQVQLKNYATNLWNRRYYIKDHKKGIYKVYNFLIQGSGAYMLKAKIIELYHWLKKTKKKTFICLNIHDEIVFSIPQSEIQLIPFIFKKLEEFPQFKVPLRVNLNTTRENWAKLKTQSREPFFLWYNENNSKEDINIYKGKKGKIYNVTVKNFSK